jgi:hypothetical protein
MLEGRKLVTMQPVLRKAARFGLVVGAGLGMMFFGFLTSQGALSLFGEWSYISNGLATVALLCVVGGPAMLAGGIGFLCGWAAGLPC